ncbi:hypothetical protein LIHA111178_07000 [Litorimonas haliclonae]
MVTIEVIKEEVDQMYLSENRKGLYLRGKVPPKAYPTKLAKQMIHSGDLDVTARQGVFRVPSREPLPTQQMISLADPYIYVAYLSAMQRWGLTNRQPQVFMFARPNKTIIKSLKKDKTNDLNLLSEHIIELSSDHRSIKNILKRYEANNIQITETKYPSKTTWLGGEYTRISTQASTFIDMLYRPDLCGGMAHVIEVWQEHLRGRGPIVLNELINLIENSSSQILKVRAGYLLTEKIKINDPKIQKWKKFAARGGSRKLDPDKPYANKFSEEWMLSLNV